MKKLSKFLGVLMIGLAVQACGNPNTDNDNMNNDDMDNMDNMDHMDDMDLDSDTVDTMMIDTNAIDPDPESI